MRWRAALTLLAGLAVVATSCSGSGDTDAAGGSEDAAEQPSLASTEVSEYWEDQDAEADVVDEDERAVDGTDVDDAASDDAEADAEESAPEMILDPDRNAAPGPGTANGQFGLELAPAEPGDSGPHVRDLQARLNNVGFTAGTADGTYGRRTERAVSAFQQINDLEPTGVVDDATLDALFSYHYEGLVLESGAEGPQVEELQALLAEGPFDPGDSDGVYGTHTVQAVWALEKLSGIPIDGDWGPADDWAFDQLMAGTVGQPTKSHDGRWVEVDLSEQLLKVYEPGQNTPVLISHVSSGNGIPWANEEHSGSSITPIGDFHIQRRINGWRESSLNIGRLYNPLYFVGGIALHGSQSVPLYPASHGCVRVPMHIAEYLPAELPNGTPVHVTS